MMSIAKWAAAVSLSEAQMGIVGLRSGVGDPNLADSLHSLFSAP
jgi:hypothetical protein